MSVDIVADLDGDGRPEVVVDRTVDQKHGVVEVVSVGRRRLLRRHTGEVTGPDDRTHHHAVGWRVGPCGDVDADGVEDYYVSAAEQAVTVRSGKSGGALHAIDYCGAWLAGERTSVAGVGDLNGDGHADFVVGANESWDEFYDAEDAVVRSGRSGLVLHRIASRGAGIDVCGIDDVNGNGVPDLACFLERRAEVRILDGETYALLLKRRLGRE
jgi:hypothetical protein